MSRVGLLGLLNTGHPEKEVPPRWITLIPSGNSILEKQANGQKQRSYLAPKGPHTVAYYQSFA